jgi:hypothetical protein
MCVTDRVSEQLAELHLTLGEGPGHDVLAAAAPVLPANLVTGLPAAVTRVSGTASCWPTPPLCSCSTASTVNVLLMGTGTAVSQRCGQVGSPPISRCIG